MTLGEKIQVLRMEAGLSQEALAEQLSVSRQAISKWELDKTTPEVKYIVDMSNLFGVTTDYLLKEDDRRSSLEDAPSPASSQDVPTKPFPSDREHSAVLVLRVGNLLLTAMLLLGYCAAVSRFYDRYAHWLAIPPFFLAHIPLDIAWYLLNRTHPGEDTLRQFHRGVIHAVEIAGFSAAFFFGFHEVVDDLLLSQVMGGGSIPLFFLLFTGLGLLFGLMGWILWKLLFRKLN